MKTNNLEDFDKLFEKWGICKSETIKTYILNREKALIADIKSKIDKEIERWEKVDEESSSYKISALYDLRKKI